MLNQILEEVNRQQLEYMLEFLTMSLPEQDFRQRRDEILEQLSTDPLSAKPAHQVAAELMSLVEKTGFEDRPELWLPWTDTSKIPTKFNPRQILADKLHCFSNNLKQIELPKLTIPTNLLKKNASDLLLYGSLIGILAGGTGAYVTETNGNAFINEQADRMVAAKVEQVYPQPLKLEDASNPEQVREYQSYLRFKSDLRQQYTTQVASENPDLSTPFFIGITAVLVSDLTGTICFLIQQGHDKQEINNLFP
ncbi:hypothetical protein M1563_03560 [Patescibacteria group bacterium]|nr:hypothetical protein [Patescibacteria group bacterium]